MDVWDRRVVLQRGWYDDLSCAWTRVVDGFRQQRGVCLVRAHVCAEVVLARGQGRDLAPSSLKPTSGRRNRRVSPSRLFERAGTVAESVDIVPVDGQHVIVTFNRLRMFFFSSRRRHTRSKRDWSSDVCSSDLGRRHNPVHWVVPPPSDTWVGEKNSAYIEALAQLRRSMQEIARGGNNPDPAVHQAARSEERRVGKEIRCREGECRSKE